MTMKEWNKGKIIHNDIDKLGYPYYHIHPYKQECVKHLVDNIPSWVEYVVIFGSATKLGHFYEKDIDICLIGVHEEPVSTYAQMKLPKERYDFLVVPTLATLYQKAELNYGQVHYYIVEEGVMVYEKLLST